MSGRLIPLTFSSQKHRGHSKKRRKELYERVSCFTSGWYHLYRGDAKSGSVGHSNFCQADTDRLSDYPTARGGGTGVTDCYSSPGTTSVVVTDCEWFVKLRVDGGCDRLSYFTVSGRPVRVREGRYHTCGIDAGFVIVYQGDSGGATTICSTDKI